MSKVLDSSVFDAGINVIKNTATSMVFCSAQPANYAGIAAVALVTKSGMTSGSYTGPAAGTVTGRKLAVNAVTAMTPSANGTVTYVVLHDGATLLAGTSVTSQAVTTAQSWNSPAFNIEFPLPV